VDIEIVFTGLRPGEKLCEELHTASERARLTRHERIVKWETDPLDEPRLLAGVRDLEAAAGMNDGAAIRRLLGELVPEYRPAPDRARASGPAAPGDRAPGAPLVGLPPGTDAGAGTGATWVGTPDRGADRAGSGPAVMNEGARRVTDAALAAVLLAISSPLWLVVWLEASFGPRIRRAEHRGWLDERVCVVNSHLGSRIRPGDPAGADGIESRAPGPAGARIRCSRFRTDLGPVSHWLGRRGLDRVPLLRNVLRGELALVGPSPTPEDSLARARELAPDFARRFGVPSGVTGLAQLSRVPSEDPAGLARRAALDLQYVAHRSRWLDVAILLRTAGFVLFPPAPARPVARPVQPGASDLEIRRGRDAG